MGRRRGNRCIGCGGPCEADCVDNFGEPYKGCSSGCRILSLAEMNNEHEPLPRAVWSGEIMGIRVHVLDDGRRIIDADDLVKVFERLGSGDLDPTEFGKAMAAFSHGESPSKDNASEGGNRT